MLLSAETASITRLSGATTLGAVVSIIEICCVALTLFPALSVTVQVIVVKPNGKTSGASLVIDAIPTRSVATIVPSST